MITDSDNNGLFELMDVLHTRQNTYLDLISKKNVTETDADME